MSRKKVLMSASAVAVVASAFVATEDVSAASHKVSAGETLWKIAQANNVSVSNLKKWNNLQHDLIFPNQVIQVIKPSGGSSNNSSSNTSSSNSSSADGSYTVKSGDSLSAIAFDNNVSLKNLMSWNNLNSTLIHPGNKLAIKKGSSSNKSSSNSSSKPNSSSSSSSNSSYVVKSGDTLSYIASRHGTSASKIANLNGMKLSDIIHVGDKLTVSGTASSNSSSSSSNTSSESSSTNSTYVVKSGDSLSKIASAHGTTAQKIASLSGIKISSIIHIGDKLTVSGKASTNTGSNNSNSSNAGSNNNSKPPANSGFSANQLMNSANSVMGTRYVWGGTTQSGGFDCSGFIHWAYNDAGKSMGRTSTDGYYSRSFEISKSELQIGDLVFFAGTYRPGISHMGIYAGSNNFIHAGSSTGVTVTSLDNSYWSKHFDSYKRFY